MSDQHNIEIQGVEDRPLHGMWHTGPNPNWITITDVPTQTQIRVYGRASQHKLRAFAEQLLDLALKEFGDEPCGFPETLKEKQK